MNVLIYEPTHSGHRFNYIRLIIPELVKLNVNITIAITSEAKASDEFKVHLENLSNHFSVYEIRPKNDEAHPLQKVSHDVWQLQRLIRERKPDHVYVPSGDGKAQLLGLLNKLGILRLPPDLVMEAILFKGSGAYRGAHLLRRIYDHVLLATLKISPFSTLHYIDPIAFEWNAKHDVRLAAKGALLGDPVEPMLAIPTTEARMQLGIPVEGLYIGTVGALKPRKGINLLIEAFLSAKLEFVTHLLLAGKQYPGVSNLVDAYAQGPGADRIVTINRYLSNKEFNLALCAMDVVCVPYPRHKGSSGIILSAAQLGKPVLATEYGWIGKTTSHFKLGRTIPVQNQEVFAEAIRQSLLNAQDFKPSQAWIEYSQQITASAFTKSLTALLRQRLKQTKSDMR